MTPERWQQVKDLFRSALEYKTEERAAFLDRACAGDYELRQEVESLLTSFDESDSIIEMPAVEAAQFLNTNNAEFLVGQQLGHYETIALIGVGGMGAVYLAQDIKLGRKVALKLLPSIFTNDRERLRRFEQEARAASSLNHPNILTIYEIGETSGSHFIATEFVEGKTLRELLTGEPMTTVELLNIAEQVASALVAAHEAGIIHRDIKPENIMVRRDSLVKVLDFGIAKLIKQEAANTQAKTRVMVKTEAGLVMGTLRYMSPEQALGRDVDERSDLFSVGVLLYEMATGQSPFAGANSNETLDLILHAEPEPISRFNDEVPAQLERTISKSLEKDRERRYSSARELLADLKNSKRDIEVGPSSISVSYRETQRRLLTSSSRLALSALVILAVAMLVYLLWFRAGRSAVSPDTKPLAVASSEIKSLAVLPLENLSGDSSQEYFADGMTEALINNLARVRALNVISRNSVMRFKGSSKPLREIARELNHVDAVITGTVRRDGGRVRVTIQLIHAATDTHLWADDYERDLTDVLKLESEVARTVADEIRIQITSEERARLASARRVNPQAHEAYLLGRYHVSKNSAQDYAQAIEHFQRAIGLAPDYAEAYAGLSDALLQQAAFAVRPAKENVPRARVAALKAIELDEQSGGAHTALGNVKYYYDWDWTSAEKEFKRALELNPASFIVHIAYGHLLHSLGRHDEAVREGQIAVQLDPLSAEAYTALGRFLYRARRYEEALPVLQRAVQLEPRSIGANSRLGSVYAELGRYTEALAVYEKAKEATPSVEDWRDLIAYVYARMGRKEEARRMVSGLKAFPIDVAAVYAALGDKDEAFRILEDAIEERKQQLIVLKEDPTLESLHSDARWKELLRRMNLE